MLRGTLTSLVMKRRSEIERDGNRAADKDGFIKVACSSLSVPLCSLVVVPIPDSTI